MRNYLNLTVVIYQQSMTDVSSPKLQPLSLAERAYDEIRRLIIRLDLAPGDVVREADLQATLDMSRTPIREALQRLARDHFVTVIPRRGMFVSAIEFDELAMLYETRAIMEPYAARLATKRGTQADWDEMADVLAETALPGKTPEELLGLDRQCHEIIWRASGNRFLTNTLDTLYAQSDRLWHMYLADVHDMGHAVDDHTAIHEALESGDAETVANLIEDHVNSFDAQVRDAVTTRLTAPLA
jgi:DNA-binding GntR family transcriptional regulator